MSWDFSHISLPKEPRTYKYNKIRHWCSFLIVLYLITSSILGIFKDLFPSVLFYSILFFIPLFIWVLVFLVSYIINASYDAKVLAITETNNKKQEEMKAWIKQEIWFYFSNVDFAKKVNINNIKNNFEIDFQRNEFPKIRNSLDNILDEVIDILSRFFQDKNIEFHISSSDGNLQQIIKKTLDDFISDNSLKNWLYSSIEDWEAGLSNVFNSQSFHIFIDVRGKNSSCLNESISWFICSNSKLGETYDFFPSMRLLRPNIFDQKMTIKEQFFQVLNEQLDNEQYEIWMDNSKYSTEIISSILERNPSFELDNRIHKWSLVNGNDDSYNYLNFISLLNDCCHENNILIAYKSIFTMKVS